MRALDIQEEQQIPLGRRLGQKHMVLLQRYANTFEPVYFDFGRAKYRVTDPEDKQWFIAAWNNLKKQGQGDRLLDAMGSLPGFQNLLRQHDEWSSRRKQQKQNQDSGQQSLPLDEDDASPRAEKMTQQLKLRYPHARNGTEALLYAMLDNEKKSQQDINRLEKETDNLEKDIKTDVEKKLGSLKGVRGSSTSALQRVQATTDKQQDIINKIIRIDQEQQQALDDLKSAASDKPVARPSYGTSVPSAPAPKQPNYSVPSKPLPVAEPPPEEQPQSVISIGKEKPSYRPGKKRDGDLFSQPMAANEPGIQRVAEMKKIERRLLESLHKFK